MLHLRRELASLREGREALRQELLRKKEDEKKKDFMLKKIRQEEERKKKKEENQVRREERTEAKKVILLRQTLEKQEKVGIPVCLSVYLPVCLFENCTQQFLGPKSTKTSQYQIGLKLDENNLTAGNNFLKIP